MKKEKNYHNIQPSIHLPLDIKLAIHSEGSRPCFPSLTQHTFTGPVLIGELWDHRPATPY